MKRLLLVIAIGAALSACNGGSRISDDEFLDEAERIAEDALLTLDDLPDGWDSGPRDDDDDEDDPFQDEEVIDALGEECQEQVGLFEDEENFPDAVVDIESDFFDDPDTDDEEEVGSGIAIYRDRGVLDDAWDTVTSFIRDCGDDFERAFRQFFEDLIEDEAEVPVTASEVVFEYEEVDDLGDDALQWTLAFELEMSGLQFNFEGNILFVRSGRTVVTVEWTDYGNFDHDLAAELRDVVVERAEEADGALPD